ncbi:hypothetical protein F5Y05DRAFT_58458 [Hypoxylon sp. FL0543]|nr:hypothetical protein F5Y05DRAFT_58458 [Hypoxylon sp. FL0543]
MLTMLGLTESGRLGGMSNSGVRQVRRETAGQLDGGTIFAIVCCSIVLVLILLLCLVYLHKRSRRQRGRACKLRQLEENVASSAPNRNPTRADSSTNWKKEVRHWQHKHDGAGPGSASGVILSPRSKPQADGSQTNSGNESVGQHKGNPEDDATNDGLFKVGSDDDDEVQAPIVVDSSVAKAVTIINTPSSPKPSTANVAEGKNIEDPTSSSHHENESGPDAADPQNPTSEKSIPNEEEGK